MSAFSKAKLMSSCQSLTSSPIYSLILEEGTVLEEQIRSGKLKLPEDEEEREMYWKVKSILEANGYIHYEISNFAKNLFQNPTFY